MPTYEITVDIRKKENIKVGSESISCCKLVNTNYLSQISYSSYH